MDKPADPEAKAHLDKGSPTYWVKVFKGTPVSVVVPPYIRFLQGILALRHAQLFLVAAQEVARGGHPALSKALSKLEASPDAKQAEITYETFFASHLLINLVSEVEHFFGSAVSAALRLYPRKMGGQTFKLSEIVSASSNDELIDRAADSVMNDLMYKKPLEYIKSLAEILSIDAKELDKYWPRFVELKACRDLGVHNNWVVNEIYLRKLKEADTLSTLALGDRIVPTFLYLEEATDLCAALVKAMADLLGSKWIRVLEGDSTRSDQ